MPSASARCQPTQPDRTQQELGPMGQAGRCREPGGAVRGAPVEGDVALFLLYFEVFIVGKTSRVPVTVQTLPNR